DHRSDVVCNDDVLRCRHCVSTSIGSCPSANQCVCLRTIAFFHNFAVNGYNLKVAVIGSGYHGWFWDFVAANFNRSWNSNQNWSDFIGNRYGLNIVGEVTAVVSSTVGAGNYYVAVITGLLITKVNDGYFSA